ncbi:MAG: hypothetical protein ABSD68_03640 [Candidatus Micrarchaeales archaeon]
MEKERSRHVKLIAPVGELPSPDKELERRLDALPKDVPLIKFFRVINEWEKEAIAESSKMEKTKKSGRIDPSTALCIPQ